MDFTLHRSESDVNSPPLVISDAIRSFAGRRALDGASLELRAGEFLGLLGPNGAGKTTLIRAIAGRLKLDSGSIRLHGLPVVPGVRTAVSRRLGIIPQNIALYENLTARENLQLFGRIFEVPPGQLSSRIDKALEWTGLAERSREPVSGFSGGMQRRLNIACGVLHEPDVILLDEPAVGVDPQSRQRIWEMLRQVQLSGVSIVLTTHQLDEAQQVCDRIVIIDSGRTIASGTFDELLDASVGRRRRVVFTTTSKISELPPGCEQRDDRSIVFVVENIAGDLTDRLRQVRDRNIDIADITIEVPTLQSVFLHFTGRELREQ